MRQGKSKDQTKATDPVKAKTDTSGMGRTPDSKPLTDQDLDVVTGGAARRGPGTQTEDDAFVG